MVTFSCVTTYSRDDGCARRQYFPFMDLGEQVENECPAVFVQEVVVDTDIYIIVLQHGCEELIDANFVSVCGNLVELLSWYRA